jgi:hypothetical protein
MDGVCEGVRHGVQGTRMPQPWMAAQGYRIKIARVPDALAFLTPERGFQAHGSRGFPTPGER